MIDLWVDFNSVDENGVTTSLIEFARPNRLLAVRAIVTVGDDDGNTAKAKIIHITDSFVIYLEILKDTFSSSDE